MKKIRLQDIPIEERRRAIRDFDATPTSRRVAPYALGAGIAVFALAVAVIMELYVPSLADFLGRNIVWFHLTYYSGIIFGLLVWSFWNRRKSVGFWVLLVASILGHTLFFFLYVHYMQPLRSVYLMIFGPIELGLIGLFIDRGMSFLRRTRKASPRPVGNHH